MGSSHEKRVAPSPFAGLISSSVGWAQAGLSVQSVCKPVDRPNKAKTDKIRYGSLLIFLYQLTKLLADAVVSLKTEMFSSSL